MKDGKILSEISNIQKVSSPQQTQCQSEMSERDKYREKCKNSFRAFKIRILNLFTCTKNELQQLYHRVFAGSRRVERYLNADSLDLDETFYSMLEELNEGIEQNIGNLNKNMIEMVMDPDIFAELLHDAPIQVIRTEKKIENDSSLQKKQSLKISKTLKTFHELTQEHYSATVVIDPKTKKIEQTNWLSGYWQNLQKIILEGKNLYNIVPFSNVEALKLQQLDLSNNCISNLSFIVDAYFPNLIKLNLRRNWLISLENIQSTNFPSLQVLNVNNNKIKNIKCLEETGFPSLSELNLSQNKISSIEVLQKASFPQLQTINIDCNLLQAVDSLSHCSFPLLKVLSICNNQIKSLNCLAQSKFPNLQAIIAYHNQIQSIQFLYKCKMPHLKSIYLNSNNIKQISIIPKLDFRNLRQFDLQSNNLKKEQFLCFSSRNLSTRKAKQKFPFLQL